MKPRKDERLLQRDVPPSPFCAILEEICRRFDGIETAVFYDQRGETIDYVSFLDPYTTRLAAAHLGVIYGSLKSRFEWLALGEPRGIEIKMSELEAITVPLGEGYLLSVIVKTGCMGPELIAGIRDVAVKIREEGGIETGASHRLSFLDREG